MRMIALAALLTTACSFGGASAQTAGPANGGVTALTGATLIDGSGAAPQANVTILIEGGHIRQIGSGVVIPADASIVDLAGKFIVPGIINAHGHVGANRDPQLRQYAHYGITTTTSMAFDPDDVAAFKAAQKAGDLRGARLLTVKYRFMSAPMHPGSEYPTPEAARAKVDEIVANGADFVKVWIDPQMGKHPRLTREYCAAVLDEARRHGKITMAHIFDYADAKMIVNEGVNILAHNVRDQEVEPEFVETLRQKNVTVISTLAREEAMFAYGGTPGFIDNPFFQKGLTAARLANLKTRKHEDDAANPYVAFYKRAMATDMKNLKTLSDGGVRIAFGTDSGGAPDRYFIQGWFEHRQMELMVEAGLSPSQVIQSFSKNAAEALGIEKEFGTLAVGKAADLLVLAKNPLDDITHMRSIETVYLGGNVFQ